MNSLFNSVFASHLAFKGASQLAHWNVVGKDFYQLHQLFGKIYEILEGQTDTFAEQARGLGIEIPANAFNQVPDLEWSMNIELVEWLMTLCVRYKSDLEIMRDVLEQEKQYGFVNVIEGFLTDSNTICYLLKSTLEI
jgi:starvation-inducible DNA-binding protein